MKRIVKTCLFSHTKLNAANASPSSCSPPPQLLPSLAEVLLAILRSDPHTLHTTKGYERQTNSDPFSVMTL